MSSHRREFLERASRVAASLGTAALPLAAQKPSTAFPTGRAEALMAAFGLRYPIFCAGFGFAANPELAIAVSNGGGLGALGTGLVSSTDSLRQIVSRTKAGTNGLFAVNYLLAVEPVSLAAALDAGADYLIYQCTEAGGHVQASRKLYEELPGVVQEAKSVPVLAAGGIANGAHVRRALMAGASGVLMGTRFLATKEAGAHDEHKTAVARANGTDTVMTLCFQDGWASAPHRVLRNRTLEMWEPAGCPPPGKRPGEGDVLATSAVSGAKRIRYRPSAPLRDDRGAIAEMPLYAGEGVGAIRDIPSAGELMARLWKECLEGE